ncbi:Cc-nbs-lrr resistance protein [Corchorus olitorius]|uniref:Cc-nbs-lrr resistance protein n=1 Tax=Corchorus olitorius TaxID=93759 RepID=A0A1R3KLB9_9ROSI|nr:Cc-nbs-lrr resistance protein [Corchorus olitorius]
MPSKTPERVARSSSSQTCSWLPPNHTGDPSNNLCRTKTSTSPISLLSHQIVLVFRFYLLPHVRKVLSWRQWPTQLQGACQLAQLKQVP